MIRGLLLFAVAFFLSACLARGCFDSRRCMRSHTEYRSEYEPIHVCDEWVR